ncbi:MAG: sulfatase [Candidatus Brocadiaceae bacterium]|nr:sulfatase [Candidatus Brocadiaceae bacterium]
MADAKPNVLFIPIDDLRPQLGCYGRLQMVTPHIDALAGEGTLFERAYCQVPVCGATRASLLTGVRPTRDRFVTFSTWADEDLPGALTLPEHFRTHGYATLSAGKVFHHPPDCAERSWSEAPWYFHGPGEDWRNYLLPKSLQAGPRGPGAPFECADVPDNAYFDGRTADQAIRQLRRLKDGGQPWFLACGFVKPHLPFNAPKRYWDLYRREDVDLADNPFPPEDAPGEALHDWGELRKYLGIPAEGPLSDDMARGMVHGYYAATSYADAQVGSVLAELDRLGLSESTIVVVWGDHGWQLGEHGLWCKHCNFNTSLNAPLIVRAPGMRRGGRCTALTEFLDVYPTLCELADLPLPDHLDGSSFASFLDSPQQPGKEAVYSRYNAGDSVRTDTHLYTEWTDDEGRVAARMLYDHNVDPDENRNLAARPENAALVAQLAAMLERIRQDARSS